MRQHLIKQYETTCLMDLRRICNGCGPRVRGSEHELVKQLASEDIEKTYDGGAQSASSVHSKGLFICESWSRRGRFYASDAQDVINLC